MWDEAQEFLLKDKYIGSLIKKWGDCTIKPRLHMDYFQGLVGEIIGQQLSGRVADVIEGRLKDKIKGRLTPNNVLKLPDEDLRSCGMAWSKVRAIKNLSERVKNRQLHIRKLKELPDDEVKKELVAVKGIGPWTADMFLMFSLARPDIFPVEDLGIKKAMAKLRLKNADRWKPHRTVASWYLWRSLENN